MSLPASPPRYSGWAEMTLPIREGEAGWRPFAVQCGVGMLSANRDGAFGPKTARAVKRFQRIEGLVQDAVVGPATQRMILLSAGRALEASTAGLPKGLLRGLVEGEGASLLAATNWYTPPGGRPGVDCGPVQWRQYGPPFSRLGLKEAFDPKGSLNHAADVLLERAKSFRQRRPSLTARRALELSVLAWNWPAGADQIVRNGALSNPDALAVWTVKPGGGSYTRAEWSVVYPSRILRYVT